MGIDPSRIKPTKTTFKGVIPGVEANCTGSVTLEVVFGSPDNFRRYYTYNGVRINDKENLALCFKCTF